MTGTANELSEELSEEWDVAEALADEPAAESEAKSPPEKQQLTEDLETAWDNLAEKKESREEVEQLFAPHHKEQLKAAGVTEGAYLKQLVGIASALEANPQDVLTKLAVHYGLIDRQQLDQHYAAQQQHMDPQTQAMVSEWQAFANRAPYAERLRHRMGQELMVNPPRPGETTADSLHRAYEVAKWQDADVRRALMAQQSAKPPARRVTTHRPGEGRGTQPTQARKPKGRKLPGAAGWRAELNAAWDELGG